MKINNEDIDFSTFVGIDEELLKQEGIDKFRNEVSEHYWDGATNFIAGSVVHLIKDYINEVLPDGLIKYTYINTETVLYRRRIRLPRMILKEDKPILGIIPKLLIGEEGVGLFANYGYRQHTRSKDMFKFNIFSSDSFDDHKQNISINMMPTDLKMSFQVSLIFSTRGQANDISNVIYNALGQGGDRIEAKIFCPLPNNMIDLIKERFHISPDMDIRAFRNRIKPYFNTELEVKFDPAVGYERLMVALYMRLTLLDTNLGDFSEGFDGTTGYTFDINVLGVRPSFWTLETNKESLFEYYKPKDRPSQNEYETDDYGDGIKVIQTKLTKRTDMDDYVVDVVNPIAIKSHLDRYIHKETKRKELSERKIFAFIKGGMLYLDKAEIEGIEVLQYNLINLTKNETRTYNGKPIHIKRGFTYKVEVVLYEEGTIARIYTDEITLPVETKIEPPKEKEYTYLNEPRDLPPIDSRTFDDLFDEIIWIERKHDHGYKNLALHINRLLEDRDKATNKRDRMIIEYDLCISLKAYFKNIDIKRSMEYEEMAKVIRGKFEDASVFDTGRINAWMPDLDENDYKFIVALDVTYDKDGEETVVNLMQDQIISDVYNYYLEIGLDNNIAIERMISTQYYEDKILIGTPKIEDNLDIKISGDKGKYYKLLIFINTPMYMELRKALDDRDKDVRRVTDFYNGR